MKFLLLGAGMQGKAVLHDLCRSQEVEKIICLDVNEGALTDFQQHLNMEKIEIRQFDVQNREALVSYMQEADVVIDLLPGEFLALVSEAAMQAGTPLVNTMYGHMLPADTHKKAVAAGISIMPEAGLDPGIDLVLCGYGVQHLDEVHELHSYCGGIPEEKALDNPLNYKISWSFDGVLRSYKLPARILQEGKTITIPEEELLAEEWVSELDFPGVGKLELILNGDAIIFAEALGLKDIKTTTRGTLRWPGHSKLWHPLRQLGFLSNEPVAGLPGDISPLEFMARHLGPKLAYKKDEQDIVAMRVIAAGLKNGKKTHIEFDLLDLRDLQTGLYAMNRTVGCTASIVAQMMAQGIIHKKGLLTAVTDIPYEPFLEELARRGIVIKKKIRTESTL
jgi:lysine 6-dehydrogenase